MINDALLAKRNELNKFTKKMVSRCNRFGDIPVRLRDGNILVVTYAEDEHGEIMFHTFDHSRVWNADGSSVTNSSFDIVAAGPTRYLAGLKL